jgi:mRNA interferase MazF
MHVKDFDNWNTRKKELQDNRPPTFKEREIWWCSIGTNVGCETDGKGEEFRRPVLIIKKYNNSQALILPLSSKIKENFYSYTFELKGKRQNVLLSQPKVIDTRRLTKILGRTTPTQFNKILEAFYRTMPQIKK